MGFDRTMTEADVIARALDLRLAHTHVALPAKVVRFDPATQMVDVKPLLKTVREHEDETETAEPIPVIVDVPVQFPGAGGFVLTFPVEVGDYCLLVFTDRSLDRWLEDGGDVDPQDARAHHLSDAVAILGVRPKPAFLPEFDEQRAFLGSTEPTSSGVGVAVKTGSVHLGVVPGADAPNFVALANLVLTELNAIRAGVDSHVHTSAAPGNPTTPPVVPLGPASPVAASRVKAV